MSVKVNTFANIITQPLAIHTFLVGIPGAPTSSIVVESAAFPSEKMRTAICYFQGEEIRYPVTPQNSGEWRFALPEADSGKIRRELDELKNARWDQRTGIISPDKWKDVTITARDIQNNPTFQVILHGAWLIGRDDVNLVNNDPTKVWKWDYAFRYQWIEDVDLNNNGFPAPM